MINYQIIEVENGFCDVISGEFGPEPGKYANPIRFCVHKTEEIAISCAEKQIKDIQSEIESEIQSER